MSILNGQSLLASAMSGLTSTYSALLSSSSSGKGISLDDLSNLSTTTLLSLGSNYSFVQYITNNFASLDKDGDGEISSSDLTQIMATMQSQGLTYSELQSLCASGSGDSTLLSTVLTYFNKIDANGDGRVTSDEITKFSYDCQRYQIESKYNSYKASETSLYYNDGVEDDTSSVLDALQPNLDSTSSS